MTGHQWADIGTLWLLLNGLGGLLFAPMYRIDGRKER